MSVRTHDLQAPGRTSGLASEWRLVVLGVVALVVAFAVLVTLATVNAPSTGGAGHGARTVTSRDAGVVRVGGDSQYRFHPLP